jgi:hypothetical protein
MLERQVTALSPKYNTIHIIQYILDSILYNTYILGDVSDTNSQTVSVHYFYNTYILVSYNTNLYSIYNNIYLVPDTNSQTISAHYFYSE